MTTKQLKQYLNELERAKEPMNPYYRRIKDRCYKRAYFKLKEWDIKTKT